MPVKTEPGESFDNLENYMADQETREFVKDVVKEHPDESVYIIPREGASDILTEKRMEIIETLREDEIESVRQLSRKLDRDVSAVSRDLEILWENDIIEYRKQKNRKIPELTTDKIILQPL